jgi:tetratricopeptide (TPR) repeat protein
LLAAALIAAALIADPIPAAADAGGDIAAAQKHWRELDYELVVDRAAAALGDRAATQTQRLEALRLQGSALAVLGKTDEAAAAFTRALTVDPDFDLPAGTSPRILAVFRPARARWLVDQERRLAMELGPAVARLRFDVAIPAAARGGRSLPIDIRVVDPGRVAGLVVVHYRRAGDRLYSASRARARPTMRVEIPPSVTASKRDYRLEVYVELQHRSKITVARRGSAESPLSVSITAGAIPSPPPVTSTWWFWAGAAALATAAVSIPILVDRARDVGPQDVVGVRR